MSDRTCPVCAKIFRYPTQMRRHVNAPTNPCNPINRNSEKPTLMCEIERDDEPDSLPDSSSKSLFEQMFNSVIQFIPTPYATPFPTPHQVQSDVFNDDECAYGSSEVAHNSSFDVLAHPGSPQNPVFSSSFCPTKIFYKCLRCDKNFTHHQSRNNHIKKNRCQSKNPHILLQNANNNTINSHNKTMINSNNNITMINNQYISPLGLEDMSFIQAKDTLKIFEKGNNITHIINTLCDLLYSNAKNQNFFKLNLSRSNVEYLNDKHNLMSIHESQFRKLFTQILIENLIRVIYESKNTLDVQNLQFCVNIVDNLDKIIKKLEREKTKFDIKNQTELYQAVSTNIASMFRKFDKTLPEYIKFLADNPDIHKENKKLSRKIKKDLFNANNEFNFPPIENNDAKHLYIAKGAYLEKQNASTQRILDKVYDDMKSSSNNDDIDISAYNGFLNN